MNLLTKAATVAAGLALVSITAASANNHAERPKVQLVAQLGARSTALDASPDPTAKVIYYTTGGERPAIFSVPAAGGAQHKLLSGALLRRPEGLAVSNDGRRLYVADTAAGHILVVPVGGAKAHVLRGSADSSPRGLEIQTRAGKDYVVYSGKARDGKPAVLRIRTLGATRPTTLVKGGIAARPRRRRYREEDRRDLRHRPRPRRARAEDRRLEGLDGRRRHPPRRPRRHRADARRVAPPRVVAEHGEGHGAGRHRRPRERRDEHVRRRHRHEQSAGGLHRARAAVPMGWADVQRPGRIYRVDP